MDQGQRNRDKNRSRIQEDWGVATLARRQNQDAGKSAVVRRHGQKQWMPD
jgi:ABC-type uncharacterized transport system ATPase subunit